MTAFQEAVLVSATVWLIYMTYMYLTIPLWDE